MATGDLTADGHARVLADGNRIPMLGLGVWQVPNGPECIDAVRWALELGYRHIDTAQAYGNEESVGRALRDSGVPRDEVFVTTKMPPGRAGRERQTLAESLRQLGMDRVDLWLVHWPPGDRARDRRTPSSARKAGPVSPAGAPAARSAMPPDGDGYRPVAAPSRCARHRARWCGRRASAAGPAW